MLNPMFAAAAMMLAFAAPSAAPEGGALDWEAIVQQTQNVVVHVPRVTITRSTIIRRSLPMPVPMPPRPPMSLIEKKADDCVKMEAIRGFSVNTRDSVDLMLQDGKQLRVKLGKDCPALGFYSGFYVKANPDKKMCAGRDSIRARSGRQCAVQGFRKLVPDD